MLVHNHLQLSLQLLVHIFLQQIFTNVDKLLHKPFHKPSRMLAKGTVASR
jgi:hypothetical protein